MRDELIKALLSNKIGPSEDANQAERVCWNLIRCAGAQDQEHARSAAVTIFAIVDGENEFEQDIAGELAEEIANRIADGEQIHWPKYPDKSGMPLEMKKESEILDSEIGRLRDANVLLGARRMEAISVLGQGLGTAGRSPAIGPEELRTVIREAYEVLTKEPYRCR
jgi:hypothetical protein